LFSVIWCVKSLGLFVFWCCVCLLVVEKLVRLRFLGGVGLFWGGLPRYFVI